MSKKSKRKIDLKSAILLLILLAALLTTSTYAWFTANKTVTITDIEVHIEAKSGLQISANGVDWKSMLTIDDLLAGYDGDTNQIPSTIEPVSTVGKVVDGKMELFYGEVDSSTGEYALKATKEATEVKGTTGRYVAFDVFLRVNKDEPNVILGANSTVVFNGAESSTNKGLQNATRVAFLKQGNAPADSEDINTAFLGQNGALSFGETDDAAGLAAKETYIWEPNSDVHTEAAVRAGKDTYKLTDDEIKTTDSPLIPYYGINQAVTTPVPLLEANDGTDTTHFTLMNPTYSTKEAMTDHENAFSLAEGVTKVRIYMWVEGQDVDCENTASGSDIKFNLELKVPETTDEEP